MFPVRVAGLQDRSGSCRGGSPGGMRNSKTQAFGHDHRGDSRPRRAYFLPVRFRSGSEQSRVQRGMKCGCNTAPIHQNAFSYDELDGSIGGGRGIRTPGTVARTVVFKTTAIDHSAIPPHRKTRPEFAVSRPQGRKTLAIMPERSREVGPVRRDSRDSGVRESSSRHDVVLGVW